MDKNSTVIDPICDFGYKMMDIYIDISSSIISKDLLELIEFRSKLDPNDSGDKYISMLTENKKKQIDHVEGYKLISKEQIKALDDLLSGKVVNFGAGLLLRSSLVGLGDKLSDVKELLKYNKLSLDARLIFTNKKELLVLFNKLDILLHSLDHIISGLTKYMTLKIVGSELTELSKLELLTLIKRLRELKTGFSEINRILHLHFDKLSHEDFGTTLLSRFHVIIDDFLKSKNGIFNNLKNNLEKVDKELLKTVDLMKVKKKKDQKKKDNSGNNQNPNNQNTNNQNNNQNSKTTIKGKVELTKK
jgi:DNA-binding transcriptional MerR regulator